MSFDSPIQIDLSQEEDLAKLATDLTLEEQVRLDEYFGEKKKGIIYLTGQELSELKFIISEESSASHQADFDTFIQEQKILSSANIGLIKWNIQNQIIDRNHLSNLWL